MFSNENKVFKIDSHITPSKWLWGRITPWVFYANLYSKFALKLFLIVLNNTSFVKPVCNNWNDLIKLHCKSVIGHEMNEISR